MKKRFLSTLMALCLALSLLPTAAFAEGDTGVACDGGAKCDHEAALDGKHYDTLSEAVEAVHVEDYDGNGKIALLRNVTDGNGIAVGYGSFNSETGTTGGNSKEKIEVEIDFAGFTYTISSRPVGSSGTESSGFQLLKNSKVTLRNGTINTVTGSGVQMLIQNYCDLTLEGMTLDGGALNTSAIYAYTLSNNNNEILIKQSTVTAKEGGVAFDVYFSPSGYPDGVSVTVENSTINGKIECAESNSTNLEGKNNLTIKSDSTINGDIDIKAVESGSISNTRVNGNITNTDTEGSVLVKSSVVTGTIANDAVVIDSKDEDGESINQIPEGVAATVGGKNYDTLQGAIDAADPGETVTLLNDVTEDITIAEDKEITLDLGTYTLKNASGHTITNNGTLTIIGSGTVDNVTHARGALVNYGTATLKGGTFTRSAEAGRSPSDNGGNSWYVIDNHGTMTIDGATVTSTGKYSSLIRNIKANENEDGVLNVVSGNLHNGFITLKNDTAGRLNVTGGTITSDNQAIQNWNEATISGGELTGLVYSWSAGADESAEAGTLTISGNAKITGNVYAVQYKYDNIEPTKAATVKIEGGTIIGTVSTATSGYGTGERPTISASMTVSGGNFSSSVREEFLARELTAELYSTSKNSQAPYSYYVSVNAALKDAKAGDTVVDLTAPQGTEKYTVTLRYGNGEADTTYTELAAGTTLALPTPTRTDYRFDGWYVNGTRYTNSYPVSGNAILVAQWTYVGSSSGGSSDPSYSPILDVSDGGSIKVNPRTPEEDDEVTITVDPDSGYEVDEVTVTDRNGREVKVTAERDGTYTFTQPRGRVTISVTFVREGGSTFFSDVPESFWAYDEIAWAYDNGYVNGTSASSFSPNASISRQQVWMILARLSGADPANMSAAREWAVTNGVSDGTTPGGAVTRQQLVALLYRYATLMGYANDQRADLSAYPDAGTVAGYAVEPMQWSVANSIVGGTSNGTLDPTGTATRAQFAVILYRFWDQVG